MWFWLMRSFTGWSRNQLTLTTVETSELHICLNVKHKYFINKISYQEDFNLIIHHFKSIKLLFWSSEIFSGVLACFRWVLATRIFGHLEQWSKKTTNSVSKWFFPLLTFTFLSFLFIFSGLRTNRCLTGEFTGLGESCWRDLRCVWLWIYTSAFNLWFQPNVIFVTLEDAYKEGKLIYWTRSVHLVFHLDSRPTEKSKFRRFF